MPVSEKKRHSNDAYNAKCDVIQIRPIKPVGAAIRAAAQASGQSLQSYIVEACADRMRREGQPLEVNAPNDPDPLP